jgi:hypothetical protein
MELLPRYILDIDRRDAQRKDAAATSSRRVAERAALCIGDCACDGQS